MHLGIILLWMRMCWVHISSCIPTTLLGNCTGRWPPPAATHPSTFSSRDGSADLFTKPSYLFSFPTLKILCNYWDCSCIHFYYCRLHLWIAVVKLELASSSLAPVIMKMNVGCWVWFDKVLLNCEVLCEYTKFGVVSGKKFTGQPFSSYHLNLLDFHKTCYITSNFILYCYY